MHRILIIEPESSGHHFSLYLKLIVKSLNNKAHIHLLTKSESRFHPAYDIVLGESGGNMITHFLPHYNKINSNKTIDLFVQQCKLYFHIKFTFNNLIKKFKFDKVFFVNIDHIEKALSIFGTPFGDIPYSGIFMNPKFHKNKIGIGAKSRNDSIYEFLFNRLMSQMTLENIGTVDETFSDYYKSIDKIKFIPEPFDLVGKMSRSEARYKYGFTDQQFVILVFGDLSLRKGIKELINGINISDNINLVLHFVGKTNDDTEVFLKENYVQKLLNNGTLLIRRGFQTEEEQFNVFISSDMVWVGYTHGFSGSSGVYYQAASLGIPVIVNNFGLLGWLVKKHKNGILCDVYDEKCVSSSISLMIENEILYKELSNNGLLLSESHKPEIFCRSICEMIVKI